MYSCILVVWRELKFGSLFMDFLGGLDTTVSMLTLVKGLEDNTFHLKFLFCVFCAILMSMGPLLQTALIDIHHHWLAHFLLPWSRPGQRELFMNKTYMGAPRLWIMKHQFTTLNQEGCPKDHLHLEIQSRVVVCLMKRCVQQEYQ